MKRIILFFIISTMGLSLLCGCSSDGTCNLKSKNEIMKEIKNTKENTYRFGMNGIHLGEQVNERWKNLIMDGYYSYTYDNVYFEKNRDGRIVELAFFTSKDSYGNVESDINDVIFEFEGKKYKGMNFMRDTFEKINDVHYEECYVYEDDYMRIELGVINGYYNVEAKLK